jgi:hypothetical protein
MARSGDDRDFVQQSILTQHGVLRELVDLVRHNKKWWLTPIIVMLLMVGFLVILSGTAVAPFIYTLF